MKKSVKYLFALWFLCSGNKTISQETTPVIDSLIGVVKQLSAPVTEMKILGADTTLVKTLTKLSGEYWDINSYEQALVYANQALKIAIEIDFKTGIATSYNNIALSYDRMGNYNVALENYRNSLTVWETIGNKKEISVLYNNIGNIYLMQGIYESALKNYLVALKYREEIGDKKGMARTYSNVGLLYEKREDYKKALEIFLKCLKLNEELGNKRGIAAAQNCIANIFFQQKNYFGAFEFYFKSLKISEEIGDKSGIAIAYNNLGMAYDQKGDYNSALDYYNKSFEVKQELKDIEGICGYYVNVGVAYTKLKQSKKAEMFLRKGVDCFRQLNNKDGLKEAYESLSDLYELQGDYKKAFEYHQLFSDLKDTLLNETSNRQIAEMNTKYESEKKEKDILLLTKDKDLQRAEIIKQKLIRNGFITGLALALVLAFVLYNRFKLTRKQKQIIEHQNSQIVESINYSKKIQQSLLASVDEIRKTLPFLFVYYKPKQLVSGDFYFYKEFKNYILLACVDCTGHGVPGGFMSTLGSLLLDRIVEDEVVTPSEILTKLNDEIIRVLHQQSGGELQDGMDLSICMIDRNNKKIEFSGARNGIIVVTNSQAKRYKANPLPVGGNYMKKGLPIKRNFETQSISLNSSDWVYMFTDGFIEQIGGINNEPMNYSYFERLLINLSDERSETQKLLALQDELNAWKGSNLQTDDILLIGFKVS